MVQADAVQGLPGDLPGGEVQVVDLIDQYQVHAEADYHSRLIVVAIPTIRTRSSHTMPRHTHPARITENRQITST
jgi:hypothetical protein